MPDVLAKVVAIVQARMGSQRLPGKVLREMAGQPMLARLLANLSCSTTCPTVVIACSEMARDDVIADFCTRIGVPVHRGSETDVLRRLLDAARNYEADVMVRLTADNPLVTGDLVDTVIEAMVSHQSPLDYAHTVDDAGWPYGLAVEAITLRALEDANENGNASDHEHVTQYVRDRPTRYRHLAVACPRAPVDASVTVDTLDDFALVERLCRTIESGNSGFCVASVLDAIDEMLRVD